MPTCLCSDFESISSGSSSATETIFYKHDLDSVMNQPGAAMPRLKYASCLVRPSEHARPGAETHSIVIALDGRDAELTSVGIAALPCPPHCGGEKLAAYPTISFEDYLASL